MRSTFIEEHLLKGTPVIEVAEMEGHSVMEIQKTYARLNLRKKGREITMPKLGKRKDSSNVVNLFAEDENPINKTPISSKQIDEIATSVEALPKTQQLMRENGTWSIFKPD